MKGRRVAKHLARCGVASRRGAEEIISQGRVTINGETALLPQTLVYPGDEVCLDGKKIITDEPQQYLLLHKPAGYLSTVRDPRGRSTVIDLIPKVLGRLYPVGRLDRDVSGVLLLTNDGELTYRLLHPRYGVEKVYWAFVEGIPSPATLARARRGLFFEGRRTAPARVKILREQGHNQGACLEITLREGRKRQVKKMCLAMGHPVLRLERISFAGLKFWGLTPGQHRSLTEEEVLGLRKLVGLSRGLERR